MGTPIGLVLFVFAGLSIELVGARPHEAMRPVMGTFARVQVVGPAGVAVEAADEALDEIERLDHIMSNYKVESDLSRVNAMAASNSVEVPTDLFRVLEASLRFYGLSAGAFDVTVAPLVDLWKSCDTLPDSAVIDAVRRRVGSSHLILDGDGGTVRYQKPELEVDLGAIGKGYAVDRSIEVLRRHGISSAVVDLGRTLYCLGPSTSGGTWKVGIADPSDTDMVVGVVRIRDRAISTSGNYEAARLVEGRSVGHLIDPRTGYPVDNDVLSVTVIADDATTADALSTAAFVLGIEDGFELIERMPEAEAVIIYRKQRGSYGYRTTGSICVEWADGRFDR